DSLKVPEIMENQDAMARMDEFIALQQKNVEKAQQQLEEARVSLQMAMQESKTQEKLKEKAFEEFIHEENVREAKEVDELTSYTHGRKA
ncbi:MAG: flagellar export protein FliJ, partial [Bacillota bacterium]|nr:flagellar export protein FliJ [Bacillota bacterium]